MAGPSSPPSAEAAKAADGTGTELARIEEGAPAEGAATALVVRPPPPALRIARSLEEAPNDSFVHIDGRGEVRSPQRYHALTLFGYSLSIALVLTATAFYVALLGPLGLAAGALLGGSFLIGYSRSRRLAQAATLIQADRLDEAEAICRTLAGRRRVPRRVRATAHQNLAAVAARRGQFELALSELRQAVKLHHSTWRRSIYVDVLAYVEIGLLINLGRVGEARARFDGRGPIPEGNYLRLQHWTCDLFVQFAEGRLTLDEEELWQRSQAALKISGAAQLLALCSWAFTERGDRDMADHLLAEAVERAEPSLPQRVPSLWAWVERERELARRRAAAS